ncbi:hypothetical protein PUN28_008313 [Cardiocondyla obscurior]|uniref:Uncharacterized protein n=1 Tax=Cardiocondyla obscurior TaxID=286306 RepID=A0AAW2FWY7_9HYME
MTLRKNDSILPDYNMWSKQHCVVKKRNFVTFQEAVRIEKYLSQFDDTEDELNYVAQQSSKQQHLKINNNDKKKLI